MTQVNPSSNSRQGVITCDLCIDRALPWRTTPFVIMIVVVIVIYIVDLDSDSDSDKTEFNADCPMSGCEYRNNLLFYK
jgi:hypothetical protein